MCHFFIPEASGSQLGGNALRLPRTGAGKPGSHAPLGFPDKQFPKASHGAELPLVNFIYEKTGPVVAGSGGGGIRSAPPADLTASLLALNDT